MSNPWTFVHTHDSYIDYEKTAHTFANGDCIEMRMSFDVSDRNAHVTVTYFNTEELLWDKETPMDWDNALDTVASDGDPSMVIRACQERAIEENYRKVVELLSFAYENNNTLCTSNWFTETKTVLQKLGELR